MNTKGIATAFALAMVGAGCTHWGTTTSFGQPREIARRPVGAPQMATTSTSSLSAGFAGASGTSHDGRQTSMVAGLSGNTDSMTRTHCVQEFDVDYAQAYSTVGKPEGRGFDIAGGIALAVLGLYTVADSRVGIDFNTGARTTNSGEQLMGGAMIVGGVGWIWYATNRLPKGPPPTSPEQTRTWTSHEFLESTGCGYPYGPAPVAPVALLPGPATAVPPVAPTEPPPARGDVEARLKKLDDLRAHGLITQEEYDAKRKALLDAL